MMVYYYLVSGGRDSTAMVLDALDKNKSGILLHSDTRLTMNKSKESLEKLQKYTGWELEIVRYDGDKKPIQILKEAFSKVPDAIEHMKKTGVFRRNMFQCCNILKHRPMLDFQKKQPEDSVYVLGLKGSDSAIHRIYRMRELRERDTFYRRHKATGLCYYYPLRDWTEQQVTDKLNEHGFNDVHSSGCTICPIFCMFESWKNKDGDAWRRSVQMADRLGIEHPAQGQQFFTECFK
jgi:3'-phosphoadenosine 5'-phosphosulfate sulfotransferase (PAPS reductase)/FAD synthetase